MQPYQEATEEISRQGELPLKIGKNLASAAATAGGAAYLSGGAINRVLPFLSKYVPENLAIKGLSKVDPRYGSFIQKAMAAGKSFDEVKDFIGSKLEEAGQSLSPAKQEKNIIQQYSPDLFQYLQDLIQKGRSPLEAGALARTVLGQKYKNIISKIEKDHKADWSSIIQTVFGGSGSAPQQQAEPTPQPGGGQGLDPGVAQILQQGNELLKRFRGQ